MNNLEDKLQQLREDWKHAVGVDRTIIEQRARLLKWAIEKQEQNENVIFEIDMVE